MCGSCLKMPIPVSTRKSPLSTASPTWGACSNVWRRWRLLSPSTARVSWVKPERTEEGHWGCEIHEAFFFFCPLAAFLKRLESCYSVEKGKKIVLRCEVVDPDVQVKWLKNGQEIKPSAKYVLQRTKTLTALEHAAPGLFLKVSFISSTSLEKCRSPQSQTHGQRSTAHKKSFYHRRWIKPKRQRRLCTTFLRS